MLTPHRVTSSDLEHAREISKRLAGEGESESAAAAPRDASYVDFGAAAAPKAEPDFTSVGENTAAAFESEPSGVAEIAAPAETAPPADVVAELDVALELGSEDDVLELTDPEPGPPGPVDDDTEPQLAVELEVAGEPENEADDGIDGLFDELMIADEVETP